MPPSRTYTLHSDLDKALLFASMVTEERLGALYSYTLQALSTRSGIGLPGMLGKPMAVQMKPADGPQRWFHGIVVEAAQSGYTVIDDVSFALYTLTLRPRPWLLTQRRSSRIFANRSVPDIVRHVLAAIGYSDVKVSLSGSYPSREYCVQYREDDFSFISRLMEQEGIYYYFTHDQSKHTLVLADGLGAHASAPGAASLPWLMPGTALESRTDGIVDWQPSTAAHTTVYRLGDYDPLNPRASLDASAQADQGAPLHVVGGLESADFPGTYLDVELGRRYAQVRLEARNAERALSQGRTHAPGVATGTLVRLSGSPSGTWDREYLVTGCRMQLNEAGYASGDADNAPVFESVFTAIDARLPYRSALATPRPVVSGLQTAVVTDAEGAGEDESIVVDNHGRVHVVFHWASPAAKGDQVYSCPVRVASSWAGKQWGALHVPRVGQEVVVSFLEGDPDRPLIIGSVYNATHMPPFDLPAEKTLSGIRSRSEGGSSEEFNELHFEDKAGKEEIYLHAQRDLRQEIKNDRNVQIEQNDTFKVGKDQKGEVVNDRQLKVGNDDALEVTSNCEMKIGKQLILKAGEEIQLVTGQASVIMKSSGEIQIEGVNITVQAQNGVKVEGQVQVDVKAGATMNLQAGARLAIKSDAVLSAEAGATATVKGAVLNLQGQATAMMSAALIKIG